jgi:hypothetical protein
MHRTNIEYWNCCKKASVLRCTSVLKNRSSSSAAIDVESAKPWPFARGGRIEDGAVLDDITVHLPHLLDLFRLGRRLLSAGNTRPTFTRELYFPISLGGLFSNRWRHLNLGLCQETLIGANQFPTGSHHQHQPPLEGSIIKGGHC